MQTLITILNFGTVLCLLFLLYLGIEQKLFIILNALAVFFLFPLIGADAAGKNCIVNPLAWMIFGGLFLLCLSHKLFENEEIP